ncbi:MAG: DUF2914 domain-containing protein, partial [Gammaproteobacteria bacterium]
RGKKPNMAPRTLAIALAAALLASVVTYALLKKSVPSDAVVQSIPTTATTEPAMAEGADQWAEDPIFVEDAKTVEITLPDTDTETAEQTQLPSKQSPPPGMAAPQEEAAQLPSETGLEAATESVPATEDARANSPEVGSGDIAASAEETGLTTEDIGQQDEPEPATPASDSATVPSAPPDAEVAHAQLRGVTRGQLTNAVQDREPVDLVEGSLVLPPEGSVNLFYFTEIRGMTGSSVMHRWTWNGQTVSEKTFAIGGERWRIFSSRSLGGGDAGRWRTSVLDATGGEIHAIELQVEEADL